MVKCGEKYFPPSISFYLSSTCLCNAFSWFDFILVFLHIYFPRQFDSVLQIYAFVFPSVFCILFYRYIPWYCPLVIWFFSYRYICLYIELWWLSYYADICPCIVLCWYDFSLQIYACVNTYDSSVAVAIASTCPLSQ